MKIIPTDIADIHIIQPLWEKLNDHNNSLHRKYFREELGEQWNHKHQEFKKRAHECRIKFDVVKVHEEIVGYCISAIKKQLEGELVSLYIFPEFRNVGIGTQLMNEHITWFKENQAKSVFIYVHPCNIGAIRFYWRFNFFSNSPLMELCEISD